MVSTYIEKKDLMRAKIKITLLILYFRQTHRIDNMYEEMPLTIESKTTEYNDVKCIILLLLNE